MIKKTVELQKSLTDYEFFLFVADLHAITVPQEPSEMRKRIRDVAAMYLAAGIDPEKTVLFVQSEVSEHSELAHILECNTYMGELERMTQFKVKSQKQETGISCGLFTYPVLMAADILLYDADYVPVGEDQKQHLEITRDLALRFNNRYGDFFTVPEPIIRKIGARIMDLQDPEKKMSKSSESDRGRISLYEDAATIRRKIKSAVTDSLGMMKYDPENQPGLANLITIYSVLAEITPDEVVARYAGQGYALFKEELGNLVADEIGGLQKRYSEIISSGKLDEILDKGRDIASRFAARKMEKCRRKVGLGRIRKDK
jgi:tryptophanyl-tRNA synthetase